MTKPKVFCDLPYPRERAETVMEYCQAMYGEKTCRLLDRCCGKSARVTGCYHCSLTTLTAR
jgi:hypothetical protein